MFRGIALAWAHDMNVKVIVLTEGKDPADAILANPEHWKEAIKKFPSNQTAKMYLHFTESK